MKTSRKLLSALVVAAATILSSCTKTVYIEPQPLPLPTLPTYPKIKEVELMCLSVDTYEKLVEGKFLREKAISECRAVIESTH